jgi:hypothetical protein
MLRRRRQGFFWYPRSSNEARAIRFGGSTRQFGDKALSLPPESATRHHCRRSESFPHTGPLFHCRASTHPCKNFGFSIFSGAKPKFYSLFDLCCTG